MSAPPYRYVELSSAVDSLGAQNIYAIVTECSMPRPTRGTDMICNLTLVDPSTSDRPELAAGIEMLCFAGDPAELPHLHRPGDIIRLHRVKVNRYNGRPQLVGKVGARGAGFAFCLYDGAPGQYAPYQTSSRHFHSDEREHQLLDCLRDCFRAMNPQQLGGNTTYLRRVKDVRPNHFFDAVVQVVAADGGHPGDPALRLLYLWDGSDALPFPMAYDTRQSEDLPNEADRQFVDRLRPFALPLADIADLSSIPVVGTALPLVLQRNGRLEMPAVGSWVKMRNLGARVVRGQLQAYFHRSSRWTPWQGEEQQQFAAEHQQRVAANHTAGWAPAGADELLTLSRHREQPWSTLRQVLMDTPTGQPRCYRVLARLMDYAPQQPEQMCHPAAECGVPGATGWFYTLKLLIEDATAQLDVILFGPDGDTFFAGLPARDLAADPEAAAAVQQRLHELLGQGCQRDGGPWMELSIKSYYTDPFRPWQSRQYRVHDTRLVHAADS